VGIAFAWRSSSRHAHQYSCELNKHSLFTLRCKVALLNLRCIVAHRSSPVTTDLTYRAVVRICYTPFFLRCFVKWCYIVLEYIDSFVFLYFRFLRALLMSFLMIFTRK